MKPILLFALLVAGLATAAATQSAVAESETHVFERIAKVFDSVDRDTSKLTNAHFAELRELGFTDGDIESLKVQEAIDVSSRSAPNTPRFVEKRVHHRVHRRAHRRSHAHGAQPGRNAQDVITPNWPNPPAGFTATGLRFWVKAFIPGRDPIGNHLGWVDNKPECAPGKSPGYPKDGMRDPYLFPAPGLVGPLAQWVKGDARGFSNNPAASHRLGAFCALFKNTAGKFKVACNKSAGWTRHWQREGFLSGGCFFVSCEQLDHFQGRLESGEFSGSLNEWPLPVIGKNPCVSPQALTPAISLDMKITVAVSGKGGSLKFSGHKGRFPAMEGYIQDATAAPIEWFRFDVGSGGVLMLAAPDVRVNQDPRTFTCNGC